MVVVRVVDLKVVGLKAWKWSLWVCAYFTWKKIYQFLQFEYKGFLEFYKGLHVYTLIKKYDSSGFQLAPTFRHFERTVALESVSFYVLNGLTDNIDVNTIVSVKSEAIKGYILGYPFKAQLVTFLQSIALESNTDKSVILTDNIDVNTIVSVNSLCR